MSVNQHYRWEVWKYLREQVCQKWPEWWWTQYWLNHQDIVLVHTAFSVQHF